MLGFGSKVGVLRAVSSVGVLAVLAGVCSRE